LRGCGAAATLAKRFGELDTSTELVDEPQLGVWVGSPAHFAIRVSPDADVPSSSSPTMSSVPVLMKFDSHEELELPLEG
jgi:hypothetical protein